MILHIAVYVLFSLPSVIAVVLFQLLLTCFTDRKSSHMNCKTKLLNLILSSWTYDCSGVSWWSSIFISWFI